MKKAATLLAVVLLASWPALARADWSLGPNLGLSELLPSDGGDNVSYLSIPSTSAGLQPGLRVGFMGQSPKQEIFLDTGLLWISTSGAHSTDFDLTGNYQFDLSSGTGYTPYVDLGLGFLYSGFEDAAGTFSATSAIFGGGVGLHRRMANGVVTLRGEVVVDYVTKGEDHDVVITPAGTIIGVKVGFDVWLGGGSRAPARGRGR